MGTSTQKTLVQLENDVKCSRLGENMLQLLSRKTSLKHAEHPPILNTLVRTHTAKPLNQAIFNLTLRVIFLLLFSSFVLFMAGKKDKLSHNSYRYELYFGIFHDRSTL